MNTTTKRHPRTLAEAFNDAHRAEWLERPAPSISIWTVAEVLLATAIGVLLAAALVFGWPL